MKLLEKAVGKFISASSAYKTEVCKIIESLDSACSEMQYIDYVKIRHCGLKEMKFHRYVKTH